jgi:formylmethanofuran dehydrogenase subunit E-like metal-binding protein
LIATEEMQLEASSSSSSSSFFNLSTTTTTNLTKFEEEKTVNLITATNYSNLQIGCKPIL